MTPPHPLRCPQVLHPLLVLLLTLSLLPATQRAAETVAPYAWRNVAIRGGGYVSGLVFHPSERDLLYARTDVGGAYRWEAARRAWIPLNDSLDRTNGNNELLGVLSLALDPHDANRVYLACGEYFSEWARTGAVLWSSDRGATWDGVDLPCKLGGNQDGRGMGERLAVDPHDGRRLLLGSSRDGLWRSVNSATNWSQLRGFPDNVGTTFVLFDPASGQDGQPTPVIYAGSDDKTKPVLHVSRDGGATWGPVAGQPTGLLVQHAALDATGALYLTYGDAPGPTGLTNGAVWKYEPASVRWTEVTPLRPDAAAQDSFGYAGLAIDPTVPGTLYVTTLDRWGKGDEVFRSTDHGANWQPLLARSTFDSAGAPYTKSLKPHWISQIAIDPFHPERAWIVCGYGIWATDRANVALAPATHLTWMFADKGLEETVIDALISPPQGAPLLSAIGDLGGFRHDNLSASPATGLFQPFHGSCPGIDFAELAPAVMVRTHWGPARGAFSLDGGSSWTNFTNTPSEAVTNGPGMVAITADGKRLIWLPKGSHPYISDDQGATWIESKTALVATKEWKTYGPVCDRLNRTRAYIYDPVNGAFYASTDAGASFSQTATLPPDGGQLRAEPGAEGHVWLPTADGIYVSEDAGVHFRVLEGVTDPHQLGFGAPPPRRTAATVFLDGTVRRTRAFFRSDDSGKSWIRISDDRLRAGFIRTITGDARVFGRVYLGTSGRGILCGEPGQP